MQRWMKWTAGSAVLLGMVVVATVASGLYRAEQKRNRYIDIKPRPVAYTTDAQTIARGRYLYSSRGCAECHGAQGKGRAFGNDGKARGWRAPTSRRPAWWHATSPQTGTVGFAMASNPMAAR